MMSDIFGDLREWGRVLDQIEQLKQAGKLDEHEEALGRVLRYRYNFELRQCALRAVPDLTRPSRQILDILLGIVADEYCQMETRLLACEAASHAIAKNSGGPEEGEFEAAAARCAGEVLRVRQPPVLRNAVTRCLLAKRQAVDRGAQAPPRGAARRYATS